MELKDFYEHYPAPPSMKGQPKKQLSINVTEEEFVVLSRIAHHPIAYKLYDGTIQGVVRWLIYYFAKELEDAMETPELRPFTQWLIDRIDIPNLEYNVAGMKEHANNIALKLEGLTYSGQMEAAIALYKKEIKEINALRAPWRMVAFTGFFGHDGIAKWAKTARIYDPEGVREAEEIFDE